MHDILGSIRGISNDILTKAFAILFAYQIQEFFYNTTLHWVFAQPSTQQQLWVRIWWFCITYGGMPLWLQITKKANPIGNMKRSFLQDIMALYKMSIPTMIAWAFKDVVAAIQALMDKCAA